MFGHRPDGKRIKNLPPIFKVMPCVMIDRADSQVYFKQDIALKSLDEYIDKKAKEGIKLSYMNIIDERICDGYYYASSFKLLTKYLKKPELLEKNVEDKEEVII